MGDLFAMWLGQFIGVLLIPAIMLGLSRAKPERTWLRVVAGLWAFGGGVYPAISGSVGMHLGAIAAGIVGAIWAILQDRRASKNAVAVVPMRADL
jgi:hypothetical protein